MKFLPIHLIRRFNLRRTFYLPLAVRSVDTEATPERIDTRIDPHR